MFCKGRPLLNKVSLTHNQVQKPLYFHPFCLENPAFVQQRGVPPKLLQKLPPEAPKWSQKRPQRLPTRSQIGILGLPEKVRRAKVDQFRVKMTQVAPKKAQLILILAQLVPNLTQLDPA